MPSPTATSSVRSTGPAGKSRGASASSTARATSAIRAATFWPKDRATRAHARSVVAEMHSGFAALRRHWSFDIVRERTVPLDDEGKRNIARIFEVWAECRARYAVDGPYLFGSYTLADIFYAPVVSRFRTYGLKSIPPIATEYMDTMWKLPLLQEWIAAARIEIADTPA